MWILRHCPLEISDFMTMVSMIVARCHVGQSYLQVIRYVLSCMKKGAFFKQPKAARRALLQDIIKEHCANRELYRHVQRGH